MQNQENYDEIHTFRAVSAQRLDWLKATVVEQGITLQEQRGTDFAAAFLSEKKIDSEVVSRVLSHPAARRQIGFQ